MRIIHETTSSEVRYVLVRKILDRLEQNVPVLFLVSGGSSAPIAAQVCHDIVNTIGTSTEQLRWLFTVSLIDERFGPVGHQDSNWQLLLDSGLDTRHIGTIPILRSEFDAQTSLEASVHRFNTFLDTAAEKRLEGGLYIVALLGIGADGHTAGILPGSPPSRMSEESHIFAAGYESAIFTRITIAPAFFPCIDYAAVWASGEAKKTALMNLHKNLSITEYPAHLLTLTSESEIFTDIPEQN